MLGLKNYSSKVQKALKRAGARIGNRIRIEKGGNFYEGLLMPRTELGDKDSIVIKRDDGYNIGIKFAKGVKIKVVPSKDKLKEEAKFELGKEAIAELKWDTGKPRISLISTGGTIASRVEYRTGGVAALESPEVLLANIPELAGFVNISEIVVPFTKMSEDIEPQDWKKLASVVAKEVNKSKGVIITHGTDTLHYTAAALSFMLRNLTKPVILVGAQRSPDRGSSDAFMNILCAAHAALADFAGVYICMHGTSSDDYCILIRGTKARKMHTSRRDAFRPINDTAIARVWPNGKINIINPGYPKRSEGKCVADVKFETKISLLKVHPGSEPKLLEWLISHGYKGIVIEGTGLGHVPTEAKKSWIPSIKKAVKKGIPVVIASQTIYGRVNPNVYRNLRILFHEAGAIPAEDMTAETAFVKLGWVLGRTKRLNEVKKLMLTNLAGEINERITEKEFLV